MSILLRTKLEMICKLRINCFSFNHVKSFKNLFNINLLEITKSMILDCDAFPHHSYRPAGVGSVDQKFIQIHLVLGTLKEDISSWIT